MSNERNDRHLGAAYLYVFTASFCLMVIEVVAGRIMAPYLGNSLYTWTSVIGVVLMGIAIGNFTGGVMAERGASWRTVGVMFTFAGFATAISYYTYRPVVDLVLVFDPPVMFATLVFSLFAFFPVSLLLSTITPMVVTRSLTTLEKAGTTVGSIYAVSAMASIAGTFVTGFLLIAFLGVKTIVLSVSALLLIAGIAAAGDSKVTKSKPVLLSLLLLWTSFLVPKFCLEESAYFCISVEEVQTERGIAKRLVLDRLTHSYVYDDPLAIEYDYENVYAVATEYVHRSTGSAPSALFIGGGGYVMPRFIEAAYGSTEIDVIEIDPGVTDVAVSHLGFDPNGNIGTVNEDARTYLAHHAPEGRRYDIVFGDAFNDYSVPYHLTTEEFVRLVHEQVNDDGIYALNLIDDYRHGRVLASFVRTVGEVFPYVEVAPLSVKWKEPGRNTYVLLASNRPIDRDAWTAAATVAYNDRIAFPPSRTFEEVSYIMPTAELEDFVRDRKGLVLTDDYVPVDNLTAPLFGRQAF